MNPDREIDLTEALAKLEDACPAAPESERPTNAGDDTTIVWDEHEETGFGLHSRISPTRTAAAGSMRVPARKSSLGWRLGSAPRSTGWNCVTIYGRAGPQRTRRARYRPAPASSAKADLPPVARDVRSSERRQPRPPQPVLPPQARRLRPQLLQMEGVEAPAILPRRPEHAGDRDRRSVIIPEEVHTRAWSVASYFSLRIVWQIDPYTESDPAAVLIHVSCSPRTHGEE
jgi:hypothetical protein